VGLGSPSDSEENDVDKNFIQSSASESESEMVIEQQKVPKKRTRVSRLLEGLLCVCACVRACVCVCVRVCVCQMLCTRVLEMFQNNT
jgi:hypothetical protein